MTFDENRIDEFNTFCNLLEEVKSLNNGSGFLERVARCIERAEQLTATDWETRPLRPSFRQWLRDGLCEMHEQFIQEYAEETKCEMDGYTYTLPFTVDVANNDLVDANGGYFGMRSVSPAELVTIAAALNDYRPWRYPVRGELPKGDNYWLEISFAEYDDDITLSYVDHLLWKDGKFCEEAGTPRLDVYAWRELPEPAPVIEEGD